MTGTDAAGVLAEHRPILDLLEERRGFDFGGYSPALLARRIGLRVSATGCAGTLAYRDLLATRPDELDRLIETITISVSQFFRNPLCFDLLEERVLPALARAKLARPRPALRVWSAGCARGEEPYSVAILLEDLCCREHLDLARHVFATDIDSSVLAQARDAAFPAEAVGNVRHRLLATYFTREAEVFRLRPEIRRQVIFSSYDMLDPTHRVPPDSIFGEFDLVLCRNLLIYFNADYQDAIFARLHRALVPGGYLVLGEAETPPLAYRHALCRVFDLAPIYQKQLDPSPGAGR